MCSNRWQETLAAWSHIKHKVKLLLCFWLQLMRAEDFLDSHFQLSLERRAVPSFRSELNSEQPVKCNSKYWLWPYLKAMNGLLLWTFPKCSWLNVEKLKLHHLSCNYEWIQNIAANIYFIMQYLTGWVHISHHFLFIYVKGTFHHLEDRTGYLNLQSEA